MSASGSIIRCWAKAIEHVAHYQVRNRGTVGGSLAHADPSAEMPGIAVTCDAVLTIVGSAGTRAEVATDFFTGPLQTTLGPDEILTEVLLPAWPAAERRWAFLNSRAARATSRWPVLRCSATWTGSGVYPTAHVGAIGVSDTPIRLHAVEAVLNGKPLDEQAIEPRGRARARPLSRRRTSMHPLLTVARCWQRLA